MQELKDYMKKHKVSSISSLINNLVLIFNYIEELVKQKQKEQQDAKPSEDSMNVDEPVEEENKSEKKVTTSGYRTARHHLYKKSKKKSNNVSFKKKK